VTSHASRRVQGDRLLADLAALASIGATPDGGVTRLAFSEEDIQGRRWFEAAARAAGLDTRTDGAANLSARLPAASGDARTLLIGSHLDTVRNGGRFDGALGVLAGLEVVRTLAELGIRLPFHLEVINFTDEEGAILGEFGSHALAGNLSDEVLQQPRGGARALGEGLERLGITPQSIGAAARNPNSLAGYLEVHVEQGRRLEESRTDLGIVTSIVGIRSCWLTFEGEAAHGGTTPMPRRRDALWGAAAFVRCAREHVMTAHPEGVMNCGCLELPDGSFNVVPRIVRLSLEMRHGTEESLQTMAAELTSLAEEIALAHGLSLRNDPAEQHRPALCHERLMAETERAADRLELSHTRLLSYAGHDAQVMCHITPTALVFVPSVDGISHHPRELTWDGDVVNAANVLLHTVLGLAGDS
jgi:N-carbamoyl-L-amino-acid hydrolase